MHRFGIPSRLCRPAALLLLAATLSGAGPSAGEADVVLHRFYDDSGDTLAACVRQVFGADFRRLSAPLLELSSRPGLNFRRDRRRLSELRRDHHGGRPIDGIAVPPPFGGDHGTILIVREQHPLFSEEGFLRTYVHELGNLLDFAVHPDLDDPRLMRHYGDPRDPAGDDDTGQRLERCVQARGAFAPRPWLVVRVERPDGTTATP